MASGGKRPNSGRKHSGRKQMNIRVTDAERAEVLRLIEQIRKEPTK